MAETRAGRSGRKQVDAVVQAQEERVGVREAREPAPVPPEQVEVGEAWFTRRIHDVLLQAAEAQAAAATAPDLSPAARRVIRGEARSLAEVLLGPEAGAFLAEVERRMAGLGPTFDERAPADARLVRERQATRLVRAATAEVFQHGVGSLLEVGSLPGLEPVPAGEGLLSLVLDGLGSRRPDGERGLDGRVAKGARNGGAARALVHGLMLELAERLEVSSGDAVEADVEPLRTGRYASSMAGVAAGA